jgi:serine/threonine-protein kinase
MVQTRTLSTARPAIVTAAHSHDQGRALLQERLALMGRIGFCFSATFYVLFNLANSFHPSFTPDRWWSLWSNRFHLGLILVFLTQWRLGRTAHRWTPRVLALVDVAGTLLACAACTTAVWGSAPPGNRKYAMLFEVSSILMLRAAVVPSSGRRTALIGLVVVPLTAHAGYLWDRHGVVLAAERCGGLLAQTCAELVGVRSVTISTVETALFTLLGLSAATLTSHVIYGLRREVDKARRLGQYTLIEKIGEGGMGTVYRARHSLLRRPTAVKLLPPAKAGEENLRRFEQEVQLTASLTHPNTVAVYDYGRTQDGIFYYAMEFLEGPNLEELVKATGPQPPARVVHVLKQICASLAEAHQLGLIHRDIKPANVILCERWGVADVVKVVDFGLAREVRPEEVAAKSAPEGVVGTAHYLSPEAIRAPGTVGPASDLYAVGAVGYYLLTGRRVFEAPTLQDVLNRHLERLPTPPSAVVALPVPRPLEALVLRCLAKDPLERPATAGALLEQLEACGDVGAWTQAAAQAWWQRERQRLARTRHEDLWDALTIDLADRGLIDAPTTPLG